MPLLSKPSTAASAAVMYVTVGALIDVWSGTWMWYMTQHAPSFAWAWYVCLGLLLTGLTLVVIGLGIGSIGRAARHAELPPPEVTATEQQAEKDAAARAPIVAGGLTAPTAMIAPAPIVQPMMGAPARVNGTGANYPTATPLNPR